MYFLIPAALVDIIVIDSEHGYVIIAVRNILHIITYHLQTPRKVILPKDSSMIPCSYLNTLYVYHIRHVSWFIHHRFRIEIRYFSCFVWYFDNW